MGHGSNLEEGRHASVGGGIRGGGIGGESAMAPTSVRVRARVRGTVRVRVRESGLLPDLTRHFLCHYSDYM